MDKDTHTVKISTNASSISLIFFSLNAPTLYAIRDLSAVKIRFGRITLVCFKLPVLNSSSSKTKEYLSNLASLVIWQRITSSPCKVAATTAGLFLVALKSENGKGITTISPFTNLSTLLHPPR